jgi:hypothetical protein
MRRGPQWWVVVPGWVLTTGGLAIFTLLVSLLAHGDTVFLWRDTGFLSMVGITAACTIVCIAMVIARRHFCRLPLALRWILLVVSWAIPALLGAWIIAANVRK